MPTQPNPTHTCAQCAHQGAIGQKKERESLKGPNKKGERGLLASLWVEIFVAREKFRSTSKVFIHSLVSKLTDCHMETIFKIIGNIALAKVALVV